MWGNKERIKYLDCKIKSVEDAVARLEYNTQVWMPDPPMLNGIPVVGYCRSKELSIGSFCGSDHILLVDIVKILLDKLGYEIKKTPQVKSGIKLTKK
jgi:hypothetical protein